MNKFTRAVAWFHVIAFAAVLFLVSTMLGGGTAMIDTLTGLLSKAWPQGTSFIPPLAKLSGAGIIVTLACILAGFLLWIFLLRKQAWAWWGLMALVAVGTAQMVISRIPTDYAWLNTLVDRFPRATTGYIHLVVGLTLLLDTPWNWRSRRSGTRRRRRKSSTASSSSRSTTRSRRRRSRRR